MNTSVMSMGLSRRILRSDFDESWFEDREKELALDRRIHRKHWEHVIIAQLARCYMKLSDAKCLGFGVGQEPMAAWFAAQGALVLATDLPIKDVTEAWRNDEHMQHAAELNEIPFEGVCDRDTFYRNVTYGAVDMRCVPDDLLCGQFDLTWSCGTFEHIGGIEAGWDFFLEQMNCLKPGGMAIHTTEYNVISNEETIDEHDLCLFRKRDLKYLARALAEQGDLLWPLQLEGGDHPDDQYVDKPPYDSPVHLNIVINKEHVTTSIVLVAVRGGAV